MIRRIIVIDEDQCVGCGLCAKACHEGAIGIVDGKAKLLRDDYCDGLGNCMPNCPVEAISFEEREALEYNESVAPKRIAAKQNRVAGGCPGSRSESLQSGIVNSFDGELPSQLQQWPCQIKLVPVNAPYFQGRDLLIAADCCAYAYGNFHGQFMKDKVTIIGCPKLDAVDYSEKLTAIFALNDIKSVTLARMEVPCCGGLEQAMKAALRNSGKVIPFHVETISTKGALLGV